jgi:hypothetical protein
MLLLLRQVGFAKHNPERLRKVLIDKFGYRKLGDSRKRLVIPSLNLENGDVHIFKTAHSARFLMDSQESVVHVAMATRPERLWWMGELGPTIPRRWRS